MYISGPFLDFSLPCLLSFLYLDTHCILNFYFRLRNIMLPEATCCLHPSCLYDVLHITQTSFIRTDYHRSFVVDIVLHNNSILIA